jgi:hypothetical protein
MQAVIEKPRRTRPSRAIREAGDRLLIAIKEKLLRETGRVDAAELRRRGYSEELIARLEDL